jgi:hypothetical protein
MRLVSASKVEQALLSHHNHEHSIHHFHFSQDHGFCRTFLKGLAELDENIRDLHYASSQWVLDDGNPRGGVRLGVDQEDQVTLPVGYSMTETT